MSARKSPIEFAALARQDIGEILLYTREHWGKAKRSEYRRILDHGFARLRAFPDLGRPRDDISPGLRAFPVGGHIVYYRFRGDQLLIARIVHPRRDIGSEDVDDL